VHGAANDTAAAVHEAPIPWTSLPRSASRHPPHLETLSAEHAVARFGKRLVVAADAVVVAAIVVVVR